MNIEKAPNNVRCDKASCSNFAAYCINTSSYKGNLSLCEDCFESLYQSLLKARKEINKIREKTKR